jgi:hypothetical protein
MVTELDRGASSSDQYFRPGLTWPRRTNGLSIRVLPKDCIFGDKGPAAFVDGDAPESLLALCAIMNCKVFGYLLAVQLARTELAQSFEVGLIQQTPVPDLTPAQEAELAKLAKRAWAIKRGLDTVVETSHAFTLPALLTAPSSLLPPSALPGEGRGGGPRSEATSGASAAPPLADARSPHLPSPGEAGGGGGTSLPSPGGTLYAAAQTWLRHVADCDAELAAIQADIDARAFLLYGIGADDRAAIEAFDARRPQAGAVPAEDDEDTADEDGEDDEGPGAASQAELAVQLLSWAVNVGIGRFDLHLASGERPLPPVPEPFDALPRLSPGMVEAPDGDGLLVDDEGHDLDIATAVMQVFDYVYGPHGHRRLDEAVAMAGARDLRTWLRRDFFPWHVKRYSKSRRKAPVLWQLSVPSGRYSVWLWIHRATADTLHRIDSELVGPKILHETRKLDQLRAEVGETPATAQRRALNEHEAFVDELRSFHDELVRVANLWAPDLDDGVIINFAPLWRLVPQAKPWQKEVKACWDKLQAGAYDWSRLAMRLWPERVVPKCRTDRSLAIAHGLEDALWSQDAEGTWEPRPMPLVPVDVLVAQRGSATIEDALAGLAAAPQPEARTRAVRTSDRAAPAGPSAEAVDAVRKALSVAIDGLSLKDLIALTGHTEAECKATLDVLSRIGDAEMRGSGRGTRWYAAAGGEQGEGDA